jgi:hypothetical protein
MMTRISEIIHGWLGWCPDRMIAPRSGTLRAEHPVSSIPLSGGGHMMQDVIMDYGSTGLSIRLFTLIVVVMTTGLFAIMRYGLFERLSSAGILMLIILILVVAVRMAHQDIKKAIIECTPDAITIRRPLFRTVTIAKDAITTIAVRENVHHSRRWLFRGAMVIFLACVIPSVLFSGGSLYVSRVSFTVFVIFYLAVIVFFGLMFYHAYIRSRYPRVLAIFTNNKKIVGLYVDDPVKLSDMLSGLKAGEVSF